MCSILNNCFFIAGCCDGVCVLFSGLIAAIRLQLPNTSHKGCFFHYTQALWRQVQALGLQQAYRVDATVERYDIICCL